MPLQEEFESQGNVLFRYRSFIPVTFLLLGLGVHAYNEYTHNCWIEKYETFEYYYEWACLLISLFGLGIRVYTIGHTPARTSGRNTHGQVAEELNQTGIYSTVRHPLYLGNFFMWLGLALLTANLWFILAFIFVYWVYYERIMFAEEQFLRRKFGEEYTTWASRTPAFIPSLKHFAKPKYSFSWRKVLKKEKNGLLGVFAVFAFFYVSGELLESEPIEFNYLVVGLVVSFILYAVLKIIRTKSSVLENDRP